MGWWQTERGIGGDAMADYLGEAFKKIGKLALTRKGASPKRINMTDLADAIEFCSMGIFKVEFNPEAEHLKDINVEDLGSGDFKAFPNRGQIKDSKKDSA